MKRSIILLFTLLGSCLGKVSTDTEYHRQLVVEGRIEAGGPAEVMLSENLPFLDVITEQTLEAAVVRYAKVTVTSDDGQSEILTGYYDRNYPTRFVYRSHACTAAQAAPIRSRSTIGDEPARPSRPSPNRSPCGNCAPNRSATRSSRCKPSSTILRPRTPTSPSAARRIPAPTPLH